MNEKMRDSKKHDTATLVRSITWADSKQSYFTAKLMVDKDLENNFLRAYAYFRWVDDVIDVSSQSNDERFTFIKRQKNLIDSIYKNEPTDELTQEEEMLADLIRYDKEENSGLQSFIRNMFALIEFDVYRKGRIITQEELPWYSETFAKSAMDGILYFIGNNHPYPHTETRYQTFIGAHIVHLLRDMVVDIDNGFINIPHEYLDEHGIKPKDVNSPPFRAWVQKRVKQARQCFREAKHYLDGLDVLRSKIVGYWYITRFEGVLDTIEKDNYILRRKYNERRNLKIVLKVAWHGLSLTFQHLSNQPLFKKLKVTTPQVNVETLPVVGI